MEKIHTVTIKGKDYPFAFSLSVFTRASAMPGAKESDLILNYSIIYQGLYKGHKRDQVKFPFPYGDEGVDAITDLLAEDKLAGGTGLDELLKIIEDCSVETIESMDSVSKKNSQPTSSNGTPSDTASEATTGKQSQESWTTSSPVDVIVT